MPRLSPTAAATAPRGECHVLGHGELVVEAIGVAQQTHQRGQQPVQLPLLAVGGPLQHRFQLAVQRNDRQRHLHRHQPLDDERADALAARVARVVVGRVVRQDAPESVIDSIGPGNSQVVGALLIPDAVLPTIRG